MEADPKTPLPVTLCSWVIRALSLIVPRPQRADWKREWLAEIWHRWQFLRHAGEWNRREAWRLMRACLGAFPDAAWHFASQETLQTTVRTGFRSPWTCIASLCAALVILAILSSGFPATRQLLAAESGSSMRGLVCVWLHPVIGGGDHWVPSDTVAGWDTHSKLLKAIVPFVIERSKVSGTAVAPAKSESSVVLTQPSLFRVFPTRPELGTLPTTLNLASITHTPEAVLDHRTWISLFRSNRGVVGSRIFVKGNEYRVAAVLPKHFQFLSREPAIYLMQAVMPVPRVMAIGRAREGVTDKQLDRELTDIAEYVTYDFFRSQLRIAFYDQAILAPVISFAAAVLASMLIAFTLWHARFRQLRRAINAANRRATMRRALFFSAKTGLALALVFTATLEWSRADSALLFASQDPASGPFLLWIYVLAVMGVVFWSLADQRARCRICLRLLCFPVRVGCPGCLLLNWSGTELLCTEGHGVLHVPHLAPSWDEESEHWVALDESWQGLFTTSR